MTGISIVVQPRINDTANIPSAPAVNPGADPFSVAIIASLTVGLVFGVFNKLIR